MRTNVYRVKIYTMGNEKETYVVINKKTNKNITNKLIVDLAIKKLDLFDVRVIGEMIWKVA